MAFEKKYTVVTTSGVIGKKAGGDRDDDDFFIRTQENANSPEETTLPWWVLGRDGRSVGLPPGTQPSTRSDRAVHTALSL